MERIEKFLAHQIPDITSALCVPIIVFIYLLTVNVPMALCLLAPVVLGLMIQGIATVATGRQMPEYHRLQGKLNSTIMQFINGMPVMKTYNMTAESYKEYSDTVTEYNSFWKRCTRDQGYTYGVFVALDGGIDCLCSYPKRGRPPRGARVTVRILGINNDSNLSLIHI